MKLELKNKYVASTGSIYYDVFYDGVQIRRVRIANHQDYSSKNQLTYFVDNPEELSTNKIKEWCKENIKVFKKEKPNKFKKSTRYEKKRFDIDGIDDEFLCFSKRKAIKRKIDDRLIQ